MTLTEIFSLYISGAAVNTEQRLIKSLLANYSKQARPVLSQSVPTNVTFGIEFIQLIKVVSSA